MTNLLQNIRLNLNYLFLIVLLVVVVTRSLSSLIYLDGQSLLVGLVGYNSYAL